MSFCSASAFPERLLAGPSIAGMSDRVGGEDDRAWPECALTSLWQQSIGLVALQAVVGVPRQRKKPAGDAGGSDCLMF
jgi:hypothetical protein